MSFDPHATILGTGSMDYLAKLYDLELGKEFLNLSGHRAEIVSLSFSSEGDKVITGSFDGSAKIWDLWNGTCVFSFDEH